ncbi:hypothetical protein SAMN04489760_105147 [Syntrophus gentianae]|uniref:Uncharacterized protein n=1 Tax=Syntrophus gentianae TaxID=43775 RepID=A0A1H7W305_9BACT|nr:hypothetical protein [Syntrophus gentianae]SEM15972.1 hypothetical protein SAMN04489760_105147 [Syntrophus gentianae]
MEWVSQARTYLTELLKKLPEDAWQACKETTIEVICDELKKMPVPIVGTLLSNTFKKAISGKSPNPLPPGEILYALLRMQESDDDFLQGLESLGENVDYLTGLVEGITHDLAVIKEDLTLPHVHISDPVLTLNYPVSDNELQFGLMNRGAGVVKVPEIELIVESYTPEVDVDYSVPMAPPQYLKLKVRLSPTTTLYPLLKLNNEPFRRFGQKGEGAEEVCIQMSSTANVRYRLRVRIPFIDEISGQHGSITYPSEKEGALEVPFRYAPGWTKDITPESMLDRSRVLSEILRTLTTATSILEKRAEDDPDQIDEALWKKGVCLGLHRYPYIDSMLRAFVGPIAELARIEKRSDALGSVLNLVHQLLRFQSLLRPEWLPPTGAFLELTDTPELKPLIAAFIGEQDEIRRKAILGQVILAAR